MEISGMEKKSPKDAQTRRGMGGQYATGDLSEEVESNQTKEGGP